MSGVQLYRPPVSELVDITRNKVVQSTLATGAGLHRMGIGLPALEEVLGEQFKSKGDAVVAENVGGARAQEDSRRLGREHNNQYERQANEHTQGVP
jgi:hypothetical protein